MFPDFTNPFAGLPYGFNQTWMPPEVPDWGAVPLPSMEGAIGGNVNPLAPNMSGGTTGEPSGGIDDTDRGRAVSSVNKPGGLASTLKGLQSPQAPQPQRISSPNAPQTRQVNSQLSTILASMGVTPQQLLRLGQTMRGG
jgi:hypothetical protein